MAPRQTELPPDRAFVVQLRQGTTLTANGLAGRVEHVASGQAVAFTSLEEIRAFMEQVLSDYGDSQDGDTSLRRRQP